MPRKSTAPFTGPPAWLDPAAERPLTREAFADRNDFCISTMHDLLSLGLTPAQAADVAANTAGETAWGRAWICCNGGGWKITRSYAEAHKARTGSPAPWWKARGNVDSADSPWCFYRVFDSRSAFLREWLEQFVPKPGTRPGALYDATGRAFWSGGGWFGELILAGYKGSPSKKRLRELRAEHRPDALHPSVRDHASMARDILTRWAQSRLGVKVDGKWGTKSEKAAATLRKAHGMDARGDLDEALCGLLVGGATA